MASKDQAGGLRERKKALTRDTIEEVAVRRFLAEGYERVRLEDICSEALVSPRTFFRYFTSKEDLVLGRLRAHLVLAEELLEERPADEPVPDSLRAVINRVAADYVAEPERELARLRLVTTTPALESGLLNLFAGFERLIRSFAAARLRAGEGSRDIRLLAAAAVSAFRVGLETWIDGDAGPDLAGLVIENLEVLLARWSGEEIGQ